MELDEQEQYQKRKSNLIERIKMIDNLDHLLAIEDALDRHALKNDFWETLSEKQQAMVRKGMEELAAGKGIPAEEVLRGLKR